MKSNIDDTPGRSKESRYTFLKVRVAYKLWEMTDFTSVPSLELVDTIVESGAAHDLMIAHEIWKASRGKSGA